VSLLGVHPGRGELVHGRLVLLGDVVEVLDAQRQVVRAPGVEDRVEHGEAAALVRGRHEHGHVPAGLVDVPLGLGVRGVGDLRVGAGAGAVALGLPYCRIRRDHAPPGLGQALLRARQRRLGAIVVGRGLPGLVGRRLQRESADAARADPRSGDPPSKARPDGWVRRARRSAG
jgi:hypothetical protein